MLSASEASESGSCALTTGPSLGSALADPGTAATAPAAPADVVGTCATGKPAWATEKRCSLGPADGATDCDPGTPSTRISLVGRPSTVGAGSWPPPNRTTVCNVPVSCDGVVSTGAGIAAIPSKGLYSMSSTIRSPSAPTRGTALLTTSEPSTSSAPGINTDHAASAGPTSW